MLGAKKPERHKHYEHQRGLSDAGAIQRTVTQAAKGFCLYMYIYLHIYINISLLVCDLKGCRGASSCFCSTPCARLSPVHPCPILSPCHQPPAPTRTAVVRAHGAPGPWFTTTDQHGYGGEGSGHSFKHYVDIVS